MIAVSSSPQALSGPFGVTTSATPCTSTRTVTGSASAKEPLEVSVARAVKVRSKAVLLFSGGVTFRPASCSGLRVIDPLLTTSVSPAALLRLAPSGMPLTWMVSASDPSRSVRAATTDSGIAVSSRPTAWEADRTGVSATAVTVTTSDTGSEVAVVVPSTEVAVIFKVTAPE